MYLLDLPPELQEIDPDDMDLATLLRRERLLEEHKNRLKEKRQGNTGEVKDPADPLEDITIDTG